MAIFPKIQSPCPYKANLAAVMDGDLCRMCKRNVVDITNWTDDERVSFLASCETEVCVTYRFPVRPALVAAAMAAAVAALPAAAQDTTPAQDETGIAYEEEEVIMVGGIKKPQAVEMIEVEDVADASIPEIPVVYETPAAATKPQDPVSGS
jgi:predicted Fe-S protein YdhL (DUF1289 family)